MKTFLIVLSLVLAVVAGWLGSTLVQTRHESVHARAQIAQLREEIQTRSAEHASLSAENARLEQALRDETLAMAELKLDQVGVEQAPPPPAPTEQPRPFRVRTYLGQESLGEAWLVPTQFGQDLKTGRFSYQPVVVLDEKYRSKFTVYETNYVAEPVSTTVNYNYTPPRTYYYPVYYPVGAPRRSRLHPRPPPATQPAQPSFPIMPVRKASSGSGSPWGSVWAGPNP